MSDGNQSPKPPGGQGVTGHQRWRRQLLALFAVLALFILYWVGSELLHGTTPDRKPAEDEAQAIAQLEKQWNVHLKREKVEPDRQVVVEASVGGDLFADEHLTHIGRLSELRSLTIGPSKVTGSGLEKLRNLRRLRRLFVFNVSLAEEELRHLKELPQLEELTLAGVPVTDAGMKHLGQLTNLRWLFVSRTRVTDAGLAELKGLTKLERFSVTGTKITNKGVKHLEALTGLELLNLTETAVTDAALESLKKLPNLRSLGLQGLEGVTDAGMSHIGGLKRLEVLGLAGTSVTDEGVKQLRGLNALVQLQLPDRISDQAFEEIKKTVRSPKAVIRPPWPRGQGAPRP